MLDGANCSVNGIHSVDGVDWLMAAQINFGSITALKLAYLERLSSNNTMGPVNARTLQDLSVKHEEMRRQEDS